MITEFQNEYRWLSNFEPCKIILDGIEYPSVEHAYMSAKCNDFRWKEFCSNPKNKAGHIKRQSKRLRKKGFYIDAFYLVDNWEDIRVLIMKECLVQKFTQEPYNSKLIATKNLHIQEGNRWGDKFWGVCLLSNEGENNLGKLIMEIRSILQ